MSTNPDNIVGNASKRCEVVGRSALPLGSSKNASKRCKADSDTLGSVSHYGASHDTLGSVSHYGVPRGIRNNNPLNIRRSAAKWKGLVEHPTDKAFCQFMSMTYGLRAAFKLLHSYYYKHNCRTIRQIIMRWAPPSDGNDTEAYIGRVSTAAMYDDNTRLPPVASAPALWIKIAVSMAEVENGGPVFVYENVDINDFIRGWALACFE